MFALVLLLFTFKLSFILAKDCWWRLDWCDIDDGDVDRPGDDDDEGEEDEDDALDILDNVDEDGDKDPIKLLD